MELKLLHSFAVLSEELHFGRAAERLCIVQPALSMQIKALENDLGVALFSRDRHKVELTAAGKIFLPEALATLAQARRAVQRVKSADSGEIGLIRMGFVSSLLPVYLPRLIGALHARYPLIELDLKDMPSTDQQVALRENKIDFGFLRLPHDHPAISTRQVQTENFIVVLPAGHPLCGEGPIDPCALENHPSFILARRFAPGFYDELLLALKVNGLTLRIIQELGEFTTMTALIAAGMGIGIMPQQALSAVPDSVVVRELRLPGFVSRIGIAWTTQETALKKTFFETALLVAGEGR
jgi:DNA-binding transcriptional LysR family regulator